MMTKIEPLLHRCVVQNGDMAGNKVCTEVSAYDIQYESECEHCGQLLGNIPDVVAHIYEELTEE